MAQVVILGAGPNGLIANHYLKKQGHDVIILERQARSMSNWFGWKVLLAKESNKLLLHDLEIPFDEVSASIGIAHLGDVRPILEMNPELLMDAKQWYGRRSRQDVSFDSGKRMPGKRVWLDFDVDLFTSLLSQDTNIIYGVELDEIFNGNVHYKRDRFNLEVPGDIHYDYLISTIPYWSLIRAQGMRGCSIMSAVPLTVYLLRHSDIENEAVKGFDYIYIPWGYHLTRASKHMDNWQIEAVVDRFAPSGPEMEIERLFGDGVEPYNHIQIPGQLFPQKLDPAPHVPPEWLLLGRHAAWNAEETIDISIQRLCEWMKGHGI